MSVTVPEVYLKRIVLVFVFFSFAAGAHAQSRTILVFGDSISAGYGIPVESGWVALLRRRLQDLALDFNVVNASVSGETTAGGLARLPHALSVHKPQIVILELGGNDGLRALQIAQMRDNLRRMIALCKAAHAQVLLVGMHLPPNYGSRYTQPFYEVYTDLAKDSGITLLPFFLDGVALNPALMQADALHPNESGQPKLLDNIWPVLLPLIKGR